MTKGLNSIFNGFSKRAFDLFASALGLIVLSPLFALAAVLIKLEDSGPVFFVQKRVGKDFKPFDLYKFRTMRPDAHLRGLPLTVGDDPRITRVGRFLRKTKIGKLPQLINVLKGDMGIVGPMPEVERYVEIYKKDYERILKVRPGIMDLASIAYNDENEMLRDKEDPEGYYLNIILPDKIKLAKDYVKEGTFIDDLLLIAKTALKLLYPQRLITRLVDSLGRARKTAIIAIELSVFSVSNYLAFYIRFDGNIPSLEWELLLEFLPFLLAIRIAFLFGFSLDRALWRYA
ncbi:MAG: sugar transferase, partial [Deltaproteobacteria bacterium]|nr:sugar transferase [Deltaproteobacteria bacterium]